MSFSLGGKTCQISLDVNSITSYHWLMVNDVEVNSASAEVGLLSIAAPGWNFASYAGSPLVLRGALARKSFGSWPSKTTMPADIISPVTSLRCHQTWRPKKNPPAKWF